jgi:hypothetical protein
MSNTYYSGQPVPGLGDVGQFQVSGIPFCTGSINASSAVMIKFPSVTSWVAVQNNHASTVTRLGFSELGVQSGSHINILPSDVAGAPTAGNRAQLDILHVKVTEIWLSGSNDNSVIAGLTTIGVDTIDNVTASPSGSNWSGSADIG